MNKNKQKGYMGIGNGWTGFLVFLMVLSAIIGWGVIEGVLWVLSHISFGWM